MNTATMRSGDELMDWTATQVDTDRKAKARDRAMLAAHRAGLDACECCGKGIKNPTTALVIETDIGAMTFGPECGRKLQKAGLA